MLAVFERAEPAEPRLAAADNKVIKVQTGFRKAHLNRPPVRTFLHVQVLSLTSVFIVDEEARLITVAINI